MSTTRLLYPKLVPRSVRRIASFPFDRILSTTFFMSRGATNCPFLTLTGLPVAAAASSRSVWRQRKAGIWRSEEHTSELQSQSNIVCRLLLEKKKKKTTYTPAHTNECSY